MTTKKLKARVKAKIKLTMQQKDGLDSIDPYSIKNPAARSAVWVAKHNAKLLAYGRLSAYRDILRELENKI